MAIRPLRPDDIPELYDLYLTVTAAVPHGFAPALGTFRAALLERPPHLRDPVVLIAERERKAVAFARTGFHAKLANRFTLAPAAAGMLLGPIAGAEDREPAAELLREGVRRLRDGRTSAIYAFDPVESMGFRFYNAGWGGLSERLHETVETLTAAGLRLRHRELCLTRRDLPVPDISPARISLSVRLLKRDPQRLCFQAYDRNNYAGACYFAPMYPSRSDRPEAAGVGYVSGLGVTEEYQGRGVGRLLLQRGMAHLREMGCGEIWLTTGSENYRAQNLYFSMGFELADTALTFAWTAA